MAKYSNEQMYQFVTIELLQFGFMRNANCTDYLRTMAMLYIETPELRDRPMKELYEMLAEDTQRDAGAIYENVRQAVFRARKMGWLNELFLNSTNYTKDFLLYIADKAISKL